MIANWKSTGGGALIGATLALWISTAAAVPMDCLGDTCSVSDGGASILVASDDLFDLEEFNFAGSNHMFAEFWLLRFDSGPTPGELDPGTDPPDFIEDLLDLDSATEDEDTNTVVGVFSDGSLRITLTYTLTGGPAVATVDETAFIENIDSTDSIVLDLFEYTDWDLLDDSDDDTGFFTSPNVLTQFKGGITAMVTSLTLPDFHDVDLCCEDVLVDDNLDGDGNLANGDGPVGPDDLAMAFQYNAITLAPGDDFTITKQKKLTIAVPEPASLALFGLGLGLAGFGFARRRKAA